MDCKYVVCTRTTSNFFKILLNSMEKISVIGFFSLIKKKIFKFQEAYLSINVSLKTDYFDTFNQKHYIMVEPEFEKEYLPQGTEVVIVEKLNGTWLAIPFK